MSYKQGLRSLQTWGLSFGSLLTLALDSVFSIIYIAVMVVYSGVLTAVTLGVVLALTFLASPAIKSQLRKAAQKMLQHRVSWLTLNGVQTIRHKYRKHGAVALASYSSFMSENFGLC